MLAAAGALVVGLLLAVGWITGLRRKVEQRTRELKDEIEERKRTQGELEEKKVSLEKEIEECKRMELEVERIHKQLVDTSRQAGQAEVASSVLHNVGNVLNSVNVSANVIADRMRASKAAGGVSKMAGLFAEHQHDLAAFLAQDDRTQKVAGFLKGLVQHMDSEQAGILNEVKELTKNIDHIKEIVAMQQSYARVAGVMEVQSIPALVEDALRMHATALDRDHVRVVRQFDPIPDVLTDKHKVLQILVNLISNAKYALSNSTATERLLTIGARMNGTGTVLVSVADNGIGIGPENLTRIFTHGFTTRKDGHGFGLHGGHLAAREMGGTLSAHSDGAGKGATFTLELPIKSGIESTGSHRNL